MTLPGFAILVVLGVIGAAILLELGGLPGQKARERGHPQADAINVLGWLGLLLGGAGWAVAMVWAYTRPGLLVQTQTRAEPASASPDASPGAMRDEPPAADPA